MRKFLEEKTKQSKWRIKWPYVKLWLLCETPSIACFVVVIFCCINETFNNFDFWLYLMEVLRSYKARTSNGDIIETKINHFQKSLSLCSAEFFCIGKYFVTIKTLFLREETSICMGIEPVSFGANLSQKFLSISHQLHKLHG